MKQSNKTLWDYVLASTCEYKNILYFLLLLIVILLVISFSMHHMNPWLNDLLDILINSFISASLVFILIESTISYRNYIKFENIREECYKFLNKFSEFFIENIIDRFLEYKKTSAEEFDRILKNDLQKFLNRDVSANNYFVRADNPLISESNFYLHCSEEFTLKNYNLIKIEEIYTKYLLEFNKDDSKLINAIFKLIRSVQESEINIGYSKRFDMHDFDLNIESFNQIIDECVNIYDLTK